MSRTNGAHITKIKPGPKSDWWLRARYQRARCVERLKPIQIENLSTADAFARWIGRPLNCFVTVRFVETVDAKPAFESAITPFPNGICAGAVNGLRYMFGKPSAVFMFTSLATARNNPTPFTLPSAMPLRGMTFTSHAAKLGKA
jgi:hypothetical protein